MKDVLLFLGVMVLLQVAGCCTYAFSHERDNKALGFLLIIIPLNAILAVILLRLN